MTTTLVTGAAGFMGSHLSHHLLTSGHTVVAIDNLSGGHREWLPSDPNFHFYPIDINDYTNVMGIFDEWRPLTTYHLAAYAAEGLSPFIRRFNYQTNLVGSSSIINACIQYESKLVFTSSMAVYGAQDPPFVEDMPMVPVDPYGIAKMATELDMHVAAEQHGLRWSIVRPHNVVGIRQNIWDQYRNVVGIFIRQAMRGQPLTIFGDGSQMRAFSDIRFLLEPLLALKDYGDSEVYNLGSDNPVSVRDLAHLVINAASRHGISTSLRHEAARHEVHQAFSSHEKARLDLGFTDNTDLQSVVEEMFDWAVTEPDRDVINMEYEISSGLYPLWAARSN